MWDKRYSAVEYAYGKLPNDFLKQNHSHIPEGSVLCLGEGEGRNAVFLAQKGYQVTAVDYSIEGIKKTEMLAAEFGVSVNCVHQDIREFHFEPSYWQGIVSIYFHIPRYDRTRIHQQCVHSLATNGVFLMESFSLNQLNYTTGGPKDPELLTDLKDIKNEFILLQIDLAQEIERDVFEGKYHTGRSAVVQMMARKQGKYSVDNRQYSINGFGNQIPN